MLISLTKFYRLGLSNGKDIILVSEEIQHAKSYLMIQNVRYHDAFQVVWDIEDSIEMQLSRIYTPKLILQPIIENAIFHGINCGPKSGTITIRISSQPNTLCFTVTDNGTGIAPEQLSQLQQNLEQGSTSNGGYGLMNVNSRIRTFFGEAYGVSINSDLGIGTSVSIRIPFMQEDI